MRGEFRLRSLENCEHSAGATEMEKATAVGGDAGDGPRRAEEGLGRGHVAALAQHGIHEIAVAVDGPVEIGPPAADLDVRLVHVPVAATGADPAVPAAAEL